MTKKLIASTLLLASLACYSAQNKYINTKPEIQPPETPGLEAKVGGPMPKPEKEPIISNVINKRLLVVLYGPIIDSAPKITEVYQYRKGNSIESTLPIAYYNNETKILYLDIKNSDELPGQDGKTDLIIPNVNKFIYSNFFLI